MNKIICDVCGTAYPETATQCPICGCAKPADDQAVSAEAAGEEKVYVHTKGGRYSKRNVRRRNRKGTQEARTTAARKSEEGEERTNVGLIAVVIVLLLAIIAVVVYIGIRFFAPAAENVPTDPTTQTTESTALEIPCTSLEISNKTIEFRLSGDAWLLEATAEPADTTDEITFTSGNEKVAIVTEDGRVTAVGGGETVITVACGDVTQECKIVCNFASIEDPTEDATEDATEDTTTGVIDPNFKFVFRWAEYNEELGKYDTTLTQKGYTWRVYRDNLSVSPEDITWVSDDPSVVTIEKGVVTTVAPGRTEIHAKYGGQTFTCIVRCVWKEEATDAEGETEGETSGIHISSEDVTVGVGNSFYLRLIGTDGKNIEVQWEASESDYVTIEGNKITGLKAKLTGITVSTTYEGVTYSCIVRISG